MNTDLASLSIRRPVLTIVMSLLITIFGVIGFSNPGGCEYPAVDPPVITVTTTYPGASADVIESQITQPLEQAINAVAGISTLNSVSREGASQITIEFTLDSNLEAAASDVRDQVGRAVRNLPPDVNPPIVIKSDADSSPIIGLVVKSPTRDLMDLSAFAETIQDRIQTVPGVSAADLVGEKRYSMRLWMDPQRLAAYGLTPLDVRAALSRENVELPSGRIEGSNVELTVRTLSRLSKPEEFNNLMIKRSGDRVVRFRDVGYAELFPQTERALLRVGNETMIGVYIRPQPGANQVDIANEVYKRVAQIRREKPADISVEVAYDNSDYIRSSIKEVEETIYIAFGLVVVVIFLFLRNWRSTLIPVLAIPVSIIGAFAIMSMVGFSINVLTLLGIVLAIGLVVDDAIVVLENIYTKIEEGMPPMQAGAEGTREIFFAVIATTVTLAAVFLPIMFMGGLSGRLFREFGVVISGAVLISAFVALTLTPMLSSRLLQHQTSHGWFYDKTEPFFVWMGNTYSASLQAVLKIRWISLLVLVGAIALIFHFIGMLPKELTPLEDRGRLWVRATAPEGASYDYMANYCDDLAKVVQEVLPEASTLMTQVPGMGGAPGAPGIVNTGFVRIFLKDRADRTRTQQELADVLQVATRDLTGARVQVTQEPSISNQRGAGLSVQFVILSPNIKALEKTLPDFLEEARKQSVFSFVDSDLKFNRPEVHIAINRDKAQNLGVSASDIASTLQAALSGQRFGYFIMNGKQYDVIGQLSRENRNKTKDLGKIAVKSANADTVQLDNLVTIQEKVGPPQLFRFNRYVSATVTANLARARTLGEGVDAMRGLAAKMLGPEFSTTLTGAARDFEDSSSSLGFIFVLALVLIYLVLAAQFESFREPCVIMLTVPLALAGALFSLWYFKQTLNVFSQIGLIMLIGLVTKNGILIV